MHPPVRNALAEGLSLVIEENQYSDKVFEKLSKANRKFGSRDRRLLASSLYGMVRHWRKLEFLTESYEEAIDLYLETHGDVDTSNMSPAERHSVCDELYGRLVEELGEAKTDQILMAMNEQAHVFLRPNTLKVTLDELEVGLHKEGFQIGRMEKPFPCLYLKERKNLFISEAYKAGHFEVQDSGSQSLAPLLNPQPGDRVIDACAGAGGKALHMSALMKNKGRLVAMDIYQWKLDELRKRARRGGVDIVETKLIENSKSIKRHHGTADKLFLDVPCTGTGVLKRKPDTKLKYTGAEHKDLLEIQAQIMRDYSKMLKVGGQMLYATCSIFPSENQNQIDLFLQEHGAHWRLDEKVEISPVDFNSDGFFAALMTKQNE